jgi:hypothetical protein
MRRRTICARCEAPDTAELVNAGWSRQAPSGDMAQAPVPALPRTPEMTALAAARDNLLPSFDGAEQDPGTRRFALSLWQIWLENCG